LPAGLSVDNASLTGLDAHQMLLPCSKRQWGAGLDWDWTCRSVGRLAGRTSPWWRCCESMRASVVENGMKCVI